MKKVLKYVMEINDYPVVLLPKGADILKNWNEKEENTNKSKEKKTIAYQTHANESFWERGYKSVQT